MAGNPATHRGQYSVLVDKNGEEIESATSSPGVSDRGLVVRIAGTIGGGGGTSMVDDSPFAVAVSSVNPVGFLADDVATDPVDEGDIGAPRMRVTTRVAYAELMDSANNPIGVAANPLKVGGYVRAVRVEKTRPADAIAYAVNDAITDATAGATNWTFAAARSGGPGTGVVTGVLVQTDHSANVAQLELDLYDTNPAVINDNVEATRLYTNKNVFLRTVTLPLLAKKTTNSDLAEAYADCAIPFLAADLTNLYGLLRTLTAFTPVTGSKYTVTLFVSQD